MNSESVLNFRCVGFTVTLPAFKKKECILPTEIVITYYFNIQMISNAHHTLKL